MPFETILRSGGLTIRIKTSKPVLVESKEPINMADQAAVKAAAPVKAVVVKKVKTYAFITVDKNNYTKRVTDLVNVDGGTIVSINVNPNVLNSYDVHYFQTK